MTANHRRSRGRLGRTALCCCLFELLHVGVVPANADGNTPPDTPQLCLARPLSSDVQGLQTSLDELRSIGELARSGVQPHADHLERLLGTADDGWPHGKVGTRFEGRIDGDGTYDKRCERVADPTDKPILPEAGRWLYALVLAHVLTGQETYAREAREVLLDFTRSSGFDTVEGGRDISGANQCALQVSQMTPMLIESAILLESYPGWRETDRAELRSWLGTEIYPITSAIARKRKNNWGTAAAFASWAIGHYFSGTGEVLEERYPTPLTLTPEEAKASHLRSQLEIIGNDWRGDARCENPGVRSHGGFPEELRRGSTGCDGSYLLDADGAYGYQIATVSQLIFHAEALRRHGDNELFTYPLDDGRPMLLEAIAFVIDNKSGRSHDWQPTKLGVLRVANGFYGDARLCRQVAKGTWFTEGNHLPFTRLTHPYSCG